MSYISLSKKDRKEMLAKIGVSSVDDLFRSIPENLIMKDALDVPQALTESELNQH
ncbi:MAG: glycine dehydrogenase, partial [Candidatus Aminicenantes bacterium]|nr:glycine dehydrogenase [Candidatus Aminicenantes bacterium]